MFGGKTRLLPLERTCLDLYLQALDGQEREAASRQVDLIDLIYRHGNRKLSLFKYVRARTLEHLALMGDIGTDVCAAVIRFSAPDAVMICEVYFDEGRLAALVFSQDPAEFPWQTAAPSVRILQGLVTGAGREPGCAPKGQPGPPLDRIMESLPVTGVSPPVGDDRIQDHVLRFPTAPPDDYLELLRQTGGFEVGSWAFLGLHLRTIPWPDRVFHVLAEDAGCRMAICLDHSGPSGKAVLLDQVEAEVVRQSASFVDLLIEVFREDPDATSVGGADGA